jgi:Ca2+-transporting ATPase
MEPSDNMLLQEKPRDPKEGILNKNFFKRIVGQGALIAVVVMVAFYIGLQRDAAFASTMAFATLTLARLFHGFNCRSARSVVKIGLLSNKFSVYAFLAGVVLLTLVLFVPGLTGVFQVSMLGGMEVLTILGLAFLPTLLVQVGKLIVNK